MPASARASGIARITAPRFPSPRAAGDLAEIVADAVSYTHLTLPTTSP